MSVASTDEYRIFLNPCDSNTALLVDVEEDEEEEIRNPNPCFRSNRTTSIQCIFSRTDLSSYTSDNGVFAFFYHQLLVMSLIDKDLGDSP